MAGYLDGHSKAVGWLKVILPIASLAILSTLFLIARGTQVEQAEVPHSPAPPGGGVETVSGPAYSGVAADGSVVSITASAAWPRADGSGYFDSTNVDATFEMTSGNVATVSAAEGSLDPSGNILGLRGNVVVKTTSGWTMQGEELDAWLDQSRLESSKDVHTIGPFGELDSGNMLIFQDNGPKSAYLMEFDGGVHLVYHP